jgi:hypothetical protein
MAAQPGAHGLGAVVLTGASHVGPAHHPGQLGGEPVRRGDQLPRLVEQLAVAQPVEIDGGHGVERGGQLAHHASPRRSTTRSNN